MQKIILVIEFIYIFKMLKFDSRGNLFPYKPIQCPIGHLKQYFVDNIDSILRKQHFEKYLNYSDKLKKLLGGKPIKQWINGSFVTKKKNPEDIDLVNFIEHASIRELGNKLDTFKGKVCWLEFGVDAYIIEVHPIESRLAKYTNYDIIEWQHAFSYTKVNRMGQKHKKGFIEIIY